MKRVLLIALFFVAMSNLKAQVIYTEVARIADSVYKSKPVPETVWPVSQVVVTGTELKQTASIVGFAAMSSAGTVAAKASTDVATLTTLLNAALVRITTLEAQITSTAAKIAGLKAITVSTTTIQ